MTFPPALALLFALADGGAAAPPTAATPPGPLAPAVAARILRVRGADIVDGAGRPVMLRGVAFGNEVWSNTRLPRTHHDEVDYQRVAAMGMNVVRFYLELQDVHGGIAASEPRRSLLADGLAVARRQHRLGQEGTASI